MLDTNPDSYMLQPDNAIPVDKWKGEVGDKGLVALIPLLECVQLPCPLLTIDLASQNFKDFRPILKEYKEAASRHQITIAEEFVRREAMAREVLPTEIILEFDQKALQKTLKPPAEASSAPSFISKLFGLRTLPPVQLASPQQGEVVMPLDIMRQQAVEGYEAMRKYIEEHGDEILEEDKKREQQMLDESKTSIMGILGRITGRGAASPSEEKAGK
jgi:mitochondrial import inner membrane translocase subunit TIM50